MHVNTIMHDFVCDVCMIVCVQATQPQSENKGMETDDTECQDDGQNENRAFSQPQGMSVQIAKARQALADNLLTHNIQLGCFTVKTTEGKPHAVQLFPRDMHLSLHNYMLPHSSLQNESRLGSGGQEVSSESNQTENLCTKAC